ncbi:MAG: inorganic diphosphatase [Phycisphaerales bacterium]|nr:inorganic diphosphatase [Phycisphaerales bacterium]
MTPASLGKLPPFDPESDDLNVVVETPRGSRNKFKYDPQHDLFELGGVLPAGMSFPFDFGFVPSTRGEDGDPLDVLLLMDEPAFCGCLVRARLIGVISAEQTERDGKRERNDRLIAVSSKCRNHEHLRSIEDLNQNLRKEIEHFFVSYNQIRGKRFKPLGQHGPTAARTLVNRSMTSKKRPKKRK